MTNSALVLMNEGLKHWVNKIRSLKLRILTRQIRCADQVHQAARSKVSLPDTGCRFQSCLRGEPACDAEGAAVRARWRHVRTLLWTLCSLFRPAFVHLLPGFHRCTFCGRSRLYSVPLPYIPPLASTDVRFVGAQDSIPSHFRTSHLWLPLMNALQSASHKTVLPCGPQHIKTACIYAFCVYLR